MLHSETFARLQTARPRMAAKDHEFADSLLAAFPRRGWSDKQAHWAGVLTARVDAPAPVAAKIIDDLGPILRAFDNARKHLKQPGFRLLLNASSALAGEAAPTALRITVATAKSRNPGDLFVAGDGAWGERSYFGRIDQEGKFHVGRDGHGREAELHTALARFAKDPVAGAKEYARLFGKCCFCNTGLTDERSTEVGYGPVCAKRYGLPWTATEKRLAKAA